MNKFQLFVFFCNTYNTLLCNGVDLNEVDKFLTSKDRFFISGYPLDVVYTSFRNLKEKDIIEAIYMMVGDRPRGRMKKGEKFIDFNPWDKFRQHINKIEHTRKITFKDEVEFFGHTKWDYKADGTFRKGREQEHSYWETVEKTVDCEAVIIDGFLIGYVRPDKPISNKIGYTEFNSYVVYDINGERVPIVSINMSNAFVKTSLIVGNFRGKWIIEYPECRPHRLTPLWIGEKWTDFIIPKDYWDNLDLKYVFKSSYLHESAATHYVTYMTNYENINKTSGTPWCDGKKYEEKFEEHAKKNMIDVTFFENYKGFIYYSEEGWMHHTKEFNETA